MENRKTIKNEINAETDRVGVGTSSPLQTFAIQGTLGEDIFSVASSTGAELFNIAESGYVSIGTGSREYILNVGSSESVNALGIVSNSFKT